MATSGTRPQNKRDDFVIQGAILAGASVLTRIIGAIYRIPVTNIIDDVGNGIYGNAFEVYSITLILSSLSLPVVVSRLVSSRVALGQWRNAHRVFVTAMMFAIVVGIVAFAVVFFGANFITAELIRAPMSFFAMRVLAPGLLLVAVTGVLRGYFQGLGTMIPTAASQIIEQIFNAIVSIVGASVLFGVGLQLSQTTGDEHLQYAYGAAGGTLGTVAGTLFGFAFLVFLYMLYRKVVNRRVRRDQNHRDESYSSILKTLVMTLVPIIFSSTIYSIGAIVGLTVFNRILEYQGFPEPDYLAMQGIVTGRYNVMVRIPQGISNGFAASVVPGIAAAITMRNFKMMRQKIDASYKFIFLITIPCTVGFIALASPLMHLLFRGDQSRAAELLVIGAITVVFYSLATVSNSVLYALNKANITARNALIGFVIQIATLVLMLVVFRANEVALVASYITFSGSMCILNMLSIRKYSKYRMDLVNSIFRPVIASIIMGVVAYGVQHGLALLIHHRIATIVAILVAMVVYAVAIIKIGTLSEEIILGMPKGAAIDRFVRKMRLYPKVK